MRVGPQRNWRNLWKSTLDAFEPVLGRTDPARAFHPRDDRITLLALHRSIDPGLGHAVELGFWWRVAPEQPVGQLETPVRKAGAAPPEHQERYPFPRPARSLAWTVSRSSVAAATRGKATSRSATQPSQRSTPSGARG